MKETWASVDGAAAQTARLAGRKVKFGSGGWFVLEEEGGGDASAWTDALPAGGATTATDLTKEAEAVFKPLQKVDGKYVTSYSECLCGEQYIVESEHIAKSPRHKTWRKGGIEVPVPPQPLLSAYPLGSTPPPLELGVNKICERCKAKTKGEDYCPDPDSKSDRRFPCRRCNGHGIKPNVGPA